MKMPNEFTAIVTTRAGYYDRIDCRDAAVSDGHLIVTDAEATVAAYAPGSWSSFKLTPIENANGSEAG